MKLSITVNKRKNKKTKNGFPIIIYASHNYRDKEWRTGYFTELAHWNNKRALPNSKHPQYYHLLDFLNVLRTRMNEVILESSKRPISFVEVKDYIFNENRDSFYLSAMALFDKSYRGTDWSAIKRFNSFYPHSSFSNVTPEVALHFRDSLLKEGNKASGVDSYIRSLKALWNKLSNKPNPFKGIITEIPDKVKTVATKEDIRILLDTELPRTTGNGGFHNFRNYWLLMFFLGGIDPEVLAKLRYDRHQIGDRIVFNRDKGRSKTACNNLIPEQARSILEYYKSSNSPYFVPIHLSSNYKTFSGNFCRRLRELSRKLELSVELRPKSARYTFIDRAQQLLIDERVTAQIVGHKRRTTTSIYTNDFPLSFQDKAHLKVIS